MYFESASFFPLYYYSIISSHIISLPTGLLLRKNLTDLFISTHSLLLVISSHSSQTDLQKHKWDLSFFTWNPPLAAYHTLNNLQWLCHGLEDSTCSGPWTFPLTGLHLQWLPCCSLKCQASPTPNALCLLSPFPAGFHFQIVTGAFPSLGSSLLKCCFRGPSAQKSIPNHSLPLSGFIFLLSTYHHLTLFLTDIKIIINLSSVYLPPLEYELRKAKNFVLFTTVLMVLRMVPGI